MTARSSTQDRHAAINAARAQRDAARERLYALQLRRVELERAMEREKRGQRALDPDFARALAALRASESTIIAGLRSLAERLEELEDLPRRVDHARARVDDLTRHAAGLSDEIVALGERLAQRPPAKRRREKISPEVDPEILALRKAQSERAITTRDADTARKQLGALVKRAAAEDEAIVAIREEVTASEAGLREVRTQIREVEGEAGRTKVSDTAKRNAKAVAEARAEVAEFEANVRIAVATLVDGRQPQELIAEWDDALPILLLPLRLETRWNVAAEPPELWVRVYPDDVAVATHEKILTDMEDKHGRAYWTARRAATTDEDRTAAWRTLATRFSANRAAWVARQTKPMNWDAADRDEAVALTFPAQAVTKHDSWTTAPHTRVLPDRFVLLGWRGNDLMLNDLGRPIDDVMVLGPSPVEDYDGATITRNELDQTLTLGESFRWVRDFQNAVTRGMAFQVQVTAADVANGFDELIVLGIKYSADPGHTQTLVEELIDNHHYSRSGFALLPQGTPTNNTGGQESGYTHAGRTADESSTEPGPNLFIPGQDRSVATDGQRLADFLGIGYDPLYHADGAGITDHADAVAMNRALYAGTLGYYLDHMLNEVVDEDALGAVRRHFSDLVTGRGPLAAVRVGPQPYGILPTSAFARWQPTSVGRRPRIAPFEATLYRVLARFDAAWSQQLPTLHTIGAPGDGAAHLLDLLGLHPSSEEFYQRVGYSYDTLRNMESLVWAGHEVADILKMIFESIAGRALLSQLGYARQRPDGSEKPFPLLFQLIWRHYHTQLDAKQLIDGQPFSESNGIKPYDAQTGDNYIDWLLAHASDATALEAQNFGTVPRPTFLLYMMLHFAIAMEAGRGLHRYLAAYEIQANELIRSRKFLNVGAQATPSVWEVYRAPANRVLGNGAPDRPLLEVLNSPQIASGAGQGVAEQRTAMQALRGMSTARLERALVELIDVLSYRLDAWQTSLFTRRLYRQRNLGDAPEKRVMGLRLGGYGYLRRVRAAPLARAQVPDESLPPELREQKANLFEQIGNGGYVHAPSLNHATAAAVLRNGYLTHATPASPDSLAVNLSSDRVRRARYLLEGVQNGQSLETLLGVQFERGMHDWTTRQPNPVILDQLKPVLRAAFPIRRTKIPQAADALNGASASTITEDYSVVNGLALAQAGAFPWGVAELEALSDDQKNALRQEKDGIANTLDSLRDLLTSEAAYQLALGNFDRAASVVQSIGDGTIPPDLEIIRTPRGTTISFTNRLVVQLSPTEARNPWPAVATVTPRALLEPALNHWLGTLMPNPDQIACYVRALDPDDRSEIAAATVTLADLGIQPIDFMYVARSQPQESSIAELEARVRYAFGRANGVGDAAIVQIAFADEGDGVRPMAEVLPLAERLRRLVGSARTLNARHFQAPTPDAPVPADNPGLLDVAELRTRVGNRIEATRLLFRNAAVGPPIQPLERALADATAPGALAATVDALRTALRRIADAGFAYAFPVSAVGTAAAQRDALTAQADSLLKRFDELTVETDARLGEIDGGTQPAEQKVALLTEIARAWFGADFVLIPRFTFIAPAAVVDADGARDALTAHARAAGAARPVDEWIHGVSCVRPLVHDFEIVRVMAEAALGDTLPLAPMQLPYREGDSWLAAEFPEAMKVVDYTVSIVQHLPQGFQPDAAQSGLLIDEWTETIPERSSVTGLTFNYNAPNSAPPQTLLLAVTPNETGSWSWDDLVEAVRDTFRRARLRAVEPDHIGGIAAIGTLLPTLVAEFSTGRGSVSLDYTLSLPAIRDPVLAMNVYAPAQPTTG